MQKINISELREIQLNLLKQVHIFCVESNIQYFLCGGTLLGAVRHKGFIPWDDDIDIAMPRPDYDKFIHLCNKRSTVFKIASIETQPNYGYTFAKAYNPNTITIENIGNRNNFDIGVHIDIFPIDGVGQSSNQAKHTLNRTRFKRELLVASNWKRFFRSKTHPWYYEPPRFIFYLLSRITNSQKLIQKLQKSFRDIPYEKSNYVAVIMGSYRDKEITNYKVFSSCVLLPFEDASFYAPCGYDEWLTQIYGDYMSLPPKEKQVTHHLFDAFFLN